MKEKPWTWIQKTRTTETSKLEELHSSQVCLLKAKNALEITQQASTEKKVERRRQAAWGSQDLSNDIAVGSLGVRIASYHPGQSTAEASKLEQPKGTEQKSSKKSLFP